MSRGRLLAARISYSNTSVNWSKYSCPCDVIFDHPDNGIVQYLVQDLPSELPKDPPAGSTPKLHSFLPVHRPEPQNYAHTEICTYKEGVRVPKPNLPETVKKEFRTIMSDRGVLIRKPKV